MTQTPIVSDTRPRKLTCQETWALLQEDNRSVLIDIRSTMEFLFVGHPKGAVHIPWMDEPDWTVNPHFVTDVRKVMLGGATPHDEIKGAPVVLICRSGKRSIDAGKSLTEAGFSEVLMVDEGFEGDLDEDHHRGPSVAGAITGCRGSNVD